MDNERILGFHLEGTYPERAVEHLSTDDGRTLLCKQPMDGMVLEMGYLKFDLGAAYDVFGGAIYLRPICRRCLKRYDAMHE